MTEGKFGRPAQEINGWGLVEQLAKFLGCGADHWIDRGRADLDQGGCSAYVGSHGTGLFNA